jgi:general secretion pathway protein A
MTEDAALRVLLRRWDIDVQDLGTGDPCGRLVELGLRCEREEGRLSNVRYFDRPVLLRVEDRSGARRFLALGALDESYGTLDLAEGSQLVPVAGIEAVWTGGYTVVWQPPPTGTAVIGPGSSGDSIRWLRRLLAEVPGMSLADNESGIYDRTLSAGVRQIQSARGLQPDGIAGPRTLIQLQNAVGMTGNPRLMAASSAASSPAPAETQAVLQTAADSAKTLAAP